MTVVDMPPIEDIDLSTIVGDMTIAHLACWCCTEIPCGADADLKPARDDSPWSAGDVRCSECEEQEEEHVKLHFHPILHIVFCTHNRRKQ